MGPRASLVSFFYRDPGRRAGHAPTHMDFEAAANRLITYSRALAKGSLSTAYGLSMGEAPVLDLLSRQPEGMSPSDLADRLGYTRSRMTRIIDSLEAKGFVCREADPGDRRRVIVSSTKRGRKFSRDRRAEGVSGLAESLSTLGEHDTTELLRVLEKAYAITYEREGIVHGDGRPVELEPEVELGGERGEREEASAGQ